MELVQIGLLLLYGLIRIIPFVITGYLIISTKTAYGSRGTSAKEESLHGSSKVSYTNLSKIFSVVIGLFVNGFLFLGMHYYHYRDFQIIGYIKNIWGLNFYHLDVEYFTMSAALAIVLSFVVGMVLRVFFCDLKSGKIFTRKQQYVLLGGAAVAFFLLMSGFGVKDYYDSQIVVSEICSNNNTYALDDNGGVADYIELYNSGMFPCRIQDLYLSDDPYHLQKLSLEDRVIPSGGILVIPCVEGVNSFSIRNQGETIYLSDGTGRILEQVVVPELEKDTAYVKVESAWKVDLCSPGESNEKAGENLVEAPMLSHLSGFYDEEFALEITSADDATVYYTLDGSVPDEGAYLYEEPIRVYDKSGEENVWKAVPNVVLEWEEDDVDTTPVPKAFLVRAVAVDYAGNRSDVVTATYFVGCEEFKNTNVLSLVAAPDDLFGSETGIYVTGAEYDEWYQSGAGEDYPEPHFQKRGREWEREAVFELFENAESVLKQKVGIRIQGNSTRGSREKRFSVFARNEYSKTNTFDPGLFEQGKELDSVIVHTSFVDALSQSLMDNRDIAHQKAEKVSFFLNGEYWYDGYIREKYNAEYFEAYYGVEKDNLVFFKADVLEEGVETDWLLYDDLFRYVKENDFSEDANYEELCEKIDVSSFIEFLCSNIYVANMDVDDVKNVVLWRSREATDDAYSDGKWRWALYDMDAVGWTSLRYYEVEEEAAVDSFSQQPRYADVPFNQGAVYLALRQNDRFCKQFVLTFMDLLNTNFSVDNVSVKLAEHGEDITWLNSFFEKRPGYMKTYLAKEFELTGTLETVTLHNEDTAKGSIQINTVIPEMKDGSWSGEYYTDYPITVTATASEGYEFVGWSGSVNSTESTMEVPVTVGGISLTAEFQKAGS